MRFAPFPQIPHRREPNNTHLRQKHCSHSLRTSQGKFYPKHLSGFDTSAWFVETRYCSGSRCHGNDLNPTVDSAFFPTSLQKLPHPFPYKFAVCCHLSGSCCHRKYERKHPADQAF